MQESQSGTIELLAEMLPRKVSTHWNVCANKNHIDLIRGSFLLKVVATHDGMHVVTLLRHRFTSIDSRDQKDTSATTGFQNIGNVVVWDSWDTCKQCIAMTQWLDKWAAGAAVGHEFETITVTPTPKGGNSSRCRRIRSSPPLVWRWRRGAECAARNDSVKSMTRRHERGQQPCTSGVCCEGSGVATNARNDPEEEFDMSYLHKYRC